MGRELLTLTTARLQIRSYTPGDLAAFLGFHTHPAVAAAMQSAPMSPQAAVRYLLLQSQLRGDEALQWHGYAISSRIDGTVVGEIGWFLQAMGLGEADLGFAIHPNYHRRGYGLEAGQSLIDYGFDSMGFRRLTAHCNENNVSSRELLSRLGFTWDRNPDTSLRFTLERTARR